MAAPLVGAAAIAAAKVIAKKIAKDAAKKSTKQAIKAAKKSKPLAEPKSAVRVKPAAKTRGAAPDRAKSNYKEDRSFQRTWNPYEGFGDGPLSPGKSKLVRAEKSKNQSASGRASRPVESPKSNRDPWDKTKTIKINSAPKKADKPAAKTNARALKAANKPARSTLRRGGGPSAAFRSGAGGGMNWQNK